jgi:hypothetical protein
MATGLAGIAIGAPAQATTPPKLCTTKGKIVDIATTLDGLTAGTFYLRNCTPGRTIKNTKVVEVSRYPTGPTCPPTNGGVFGSGPVNPHEYDHVPFATGFTSSCHGRYTHTFTLTQGRTVLDKAVASFVVS